MSKYDILTPAPRSILEGELNINELCLGSTLNGIQKLVLRRFPKKNTSILESLAYEYNSIGFTERGGHFRRRSQNEQILFTEHCASFGLKVLPPLSHNEAYIENLFLENAETLDVFLTHATDEEAAQCTQDIYMDMYKAHKAGVVYGDRWEKNILIVPKMGVVNIDFDIEISGPFAKEFEATQVACYILAGSNVKIIPQLAKLLSAPDVKFNMKIVETFLRGHAEHFDADKKYGNIEAKLNTLIALIHKEYESYLRNN